MSLYELNNLKRMAWLSECHYDAEGLETSAEAMCSLWLDIIAEINERKTQKAEG
jgi:hypothetical protein